MTNHSAASHGAAPRGAWRERERGGGVSKLNSKHRNLSTKPSTSSTVGQIKDACTHKLLSTHKSTSSALWRTRL